MITNSQLFCQTKVTRCLRLETLGARNLFICEPGLPNFNVLH